MLSSDSLHPVALRLSASLDDVRLVTSDLILVEMLNKAGGLGGHVRCQFAELAEQLRELKIGLLLVPFSQELLDAALELYKARYDKSWSLVDCSSFVIMGRLNIQEALTSDHHFEQAGFSALMK